MRSARNLYVPLWCKSNFSFLEGASHPEELVEQAHAFGLPAVAITDRDGVYGVVRAHVRAQELGIQLLLGATVGIDDGSDLVLLVENRAGWANLCQLLTRGRRRSKKGECLVHHQEVLEHADGLLALWNGETSAPELLRDAFRDRLYAVVARHLEAEECEHEQALRERAEALDLSIVATVEVLYHTVARRPLQDVLTCIRHGVTVHGAGRCTQPNAEHVLRPPIAFGHLFDHDREAITRTLEIAERCSFSLDGLRYRYPSERLPDGSTSAEWLGTLTYNGARERYGERVPDRVRQQLDKELALIDKLDYPGYFLTMHEIVDFCQKNAILCQGRGSAANSAVCYCLGITAIDPVKMDLLFERFLSEERCEPPDIDLDIAHERREEVLQHVYTRYGRTHAAMVANVIRYRTKSAIRDVGKALDVPATSIDRLAKLAFQDDGDWAAVLQSAGLDPESPVHAWLVRLVDEIQDFPRHLSIHPGGFLLGHEPVETIVPIENGAMADRTVIQWDKDDLETLGLFKVDCLGLGALTLCDKAFALLDEHRDLDIDLATIPPDDPETYDMCCRGDTVGVFQIESRAQMAMLPRLRPRTFYDLVIEISIVRPGPIAGDMVHPYLRRRNGEEEVVYPHACLEPVLKKTLGVPLFQEQVMKLAMVAADYTPGEADQLRRDMAAWRKSGRIDRHRDRLVSRMRKKGIVPAFAERVFEQIRGFGEYGFPESHAASFALIAYATSWLRCHHTDVFTCALLNAQPMGFYSTSTIVEDAKRHGVSVRPIDIVHSHWDSTLEPVAGERWLALRMGLRWVKSLAQATGHAIVAARKDHAFCDLDDFFRRVRPNRRDLEALAEAGALVAFTQSRPHALWDAWKLATTPRDALPLVACEPTPVLRDLNAFETIAWDYRRTSHSPRAHPLAPLRAALREQHLIDAATVRQLRNKSRTRTAGLVICRQRPDTAKGVVFLTLEDETGFVNVVIFQEVFDRFATLIKAEAFLAVDGKVQSKDSVVHVVANRFWVPEVGEGVSGGGSRDFC
ncbi:MAG: error-prone DNA polymerase [Planctomycetes bacterium]|nr:error-prone DNA polymerase [Planctomycetota bacterium]